MKISATAKFVSMSPHKLSLVRSVIIGKDIEEAMSVLSLMPEKAAKIINKVLNSALANAVNIHGQKKNELVVEQILIDSGPTLKRFRPRARGSAASIRHRTSHIKTILTTKIVEKDQSTKKIAKIKSETKVQESKAKNHSNKEVAK